MHSDLLLLGAAVLWAQLICDLIPFSLLSVDSLTADSMKFSQTLKFNRRPDWEIHYINYAHLKRLITKVQQAEFAEQNNLPLHFGDEEAGVRSPLLSQTSFNRQQSVSAALTRQQSFTISAAQCDEAFIKALDSELARIIQFYMRKESELLARFESAALRIHSIEGPALPGPAALDTAQRIQFWSQDTKEIALEREKLRSEMTDLYEQLHALSKYLELNFTGFRKILKKHDKMTSQVITAVTRLQLHPANCAHQHTQHKPMA